MPRLRPLIPDCFTSILLAGWLVACAATPIPTATVPAVARSSPTAAPTTVQPSPTPLPTAQPPTRAAASPTPLPFRTALPAVMTASPVPVYGYRVVNTYPHDRAAFTQGLVFRDGVLYEGTGLNGQSSLRKVELPTGKVLQIRPLAPEHFGEGITIFGDRIIQLTWKSRVGFVYDLATFNLTQQFNYATEGWGLTHDGTRLIMSDGTANLYFLDPQTLQVTGHVQVRDGDRPVVQLNELEYVRGEVYANIWQTDRVARIDPNTGRVMGWIDLAGLLSPEDQTMPVDVLNGIAYDAATDRLFVTGKLWPKLFEIQLVK